MTETFFLEKGFLFLLILARVTGFLSFAPVIGGRTIPRSIRAAEAAVFALLIFSTQFALASPSLPGYLAGTLFIASEYLIGLAVGAMLALLFSALALLGDLAGRLGGFSVSASFDPAFGESVPTLSTFLTLLGMTVFVLCGGLDAAVTGLLDSFSTLSVGKPLQTANIAAALTAAIQTAFELAFRMALPVIAATLSIWLAVGLLGRTLARLNTMSLGFTGNTLVALSVLGFGLAGSLRLFERELPNVLEMIRAGWPTF